MKPLKNSALSINSFDKYFTHTKDTYPKVIGAFSFVNLAFLGIYMVLTVFLVTIVFSILGAMGLLSELDRSDLSSVSNNLKNQIAEVYPEPMLLSNELEEGISENDVFIDDENNPSEEGFDLDRFDQNISSGLESQDVQDSIDDFEIAMQDFKTFLQENPVTVLTMVLVVLLFILVLIVVGLWHKLCYWLVMKNYTEHKEFGLIVTLKEGLSYFWVATWLGFRKFLYVFKIPALVALLSFLILLGSAALGNSNPFFMATAILGPITFIVFLIKASIEVVLTDPLLVSGKRDKSISTWEESKAPIDQSIAMVKNNWWRTFLLVFIVTFLIGFVSGILEYIPFVGWIISLFLITPAYYIFLYIMTMEVRTEHEKNPVKES